MSSFSCWDSHECERRVVSLVLILILFWVAFVLYPAPSPGFDYARVWCSPELAASLHRISFSLEQEFQSSWAFDVWFLNLFPRVHPFVFNEGGWSTLSFIPTLARWLWDF